MKHGFRLGASAALAVTVLGAAAIAPASQANATTVTFQSFGGSFPLYQAPPGERLYTDFSSGLPSGAMGNGGLYGPNLTSQCFGGNCVAAPDAGASGLTAGQFFAVLPGQSETFTFGYAAKNVSVYVGSLDDENSLTINYKNGTTKTYSGDDLAAVSGEPTPIPGCDSTIFGPLTDGRWVFTDTSLDIMPTMEIGIA